jgi:3-oxoacyl-[acyl-carrier protein] reductase
MLVRKVMALPRYGTGEEIASLAAYLASLEATYATGVGLTTDGRFSA